MIGGPEMHLLTVEDVSNILRVSKAWVRDHATRRTPRLPSVKVGGLLRFRPERIEEFIREMERGEGSTPERLGRGDRDKAA